MPQGQCAGRGNGCLTTGRRRRTPADDTTKLLSYVGLICLTSSLAVRRPLSLGELARLLDVPKSTLHDRVMQAHDEVGRIFLEEPDAPGDEPAEDRDERIVRNASRRRTKPVPDSDRS